MANKMKTLGVQTGLLTQAVSDGELNMPRSSGGGSSHSLGGTSRPGSAQGEEGPASRVVSWAVCFEKLLEDPDGVRYFTAFLKSEVSAENILFWQACEKFRQIPLTKMDELKERSRIIYSTYLSDSSFHAVNIDDTARTDESDLEKPSPDMFQKAQQQIFKLMKFDSYARFVRSQLYQSCMLACVEGLPLPDVGLPESQSESPGEWVSPPSHRKGLEGKGPSSDTKDNKKKRLEKRGSWGDVSYQRLTVSRKDSQMSVKSSSSVELGSSHSRLENGRSSWMDATDSLEACSGPDQRFCRVYLPDGTRNLVPARPGLPLRDVLSSLCEKRGFPLKDVIIYLHSKDKQRLSLDQDISVLRDQRVTLELIVTFMLEVSSTGKTIGIKVKSSKTLAEALSSALQKHNIRQEDALITLSGSKEPLRMNTNVFRLANKTLCLHQVKGSEVTEARQTDASLRASPNLRKQEMDGLVEMLNRVQSCRVDDQRGLLTKEQLVLPHFLQVPEGQAEEGGGGDNQVLGGVTLSQGEARGNASPSTSSSTTPAQARASSEATGMPSVPSSAKTD